MVDFFVCKNKMKPLVAENDGIIDPSDLSLQQDLSVTSGWSERTTLLQTVDNYTQRIQEVCHGSLRTATTVAVLQVSML